MTIFDALRRWMGGGSSGNGSSGDDGAGGPGGPGDPGGEGGMISCEDALSRIYEYLDGELDGVTHEEVDRHFRVCARCYPHLQLEQAFRDALHRAVETQEAAPPELRNRVLELMEEELDEG